MRPTPIHAIGILSLCIGALVAGCGGEEKKKPATQVAAKVNSEEISVHQINAVLARAGNLSGEQAEKAGQEVLSKLVDQELLVQKALEKKLDRDPNVMQSVEASRRQILAQAYLEQSTSAATKPSPDEVKVYFDQHPELFLQRRVYRLQEIAVAADPARLPAIREEVERAKSIADLVAWLKTNNIKFAANATTKAAEQLPMELLPRLHQMKDGQASAFSAGKGILIIQVVASQSAPLDLAAATPMIEQFKLNQRRAELAAKELAQLRSSATIEYVGNFAKREPAAAAQTPATPAPPAAAAAPTGGVSQESVSRGVAGLK